VDQQRIIFESSPVYLVVCLALAIGLSYLLYRTSHPWSKTWNRILSGARFVLIFTLLFLLLGPIVRQINNLFKKQVFVILYDNSGSVRETTDSILLNNTAKQLDETRERLSNSGYDVRTLGLSGEEIEDIKYNQSTTDLNAALRKISNRFEGEKIAGVILPSDGIFNKGMSPLFANYNFPVHTIGLGDTLERTDAGIRNIAFNRIAYQGNKFPVRVEVIAKNLPNQSLRVSLLQRGKVLEQKTQNTSSEELLTFDFQPVATDQGMQKLDVQVEIKPGEFNTRNNSAAVFVEVIEGKKQILLVAPTPHPDMKALGEVIEKNSNYEFHLHVPGIKELDANALRPEKYDLAIFHQAPDLSRKTTALFQQFLKSKASLFLIYGQQTDLRVIAQQNMPLKFEGAPRDFDQVTPVMNPSFNSFSVSPETNTLMTDYPPVSVHFGKIQTPLTSTILLYQRVGSVATEKPLLVLDQQDGRKIAIMLGEGLWRWRLNEYDRTENTTSFDELFGKLIQYLSTVEDKRKFRSNPIQQEFSDTEPVVFESQVYNDIFEPVYGNTIDITITDEQGKKFNYSYVTSPGNSRYQIGGLGEGVYQFQSKTTINGTPEQVRGEFAVIKRQTELLNLTADFALLKKLSSNTGGEFYHVNQLDQLNADLTRIEASSVIYSEETYDSLINIKWVFWILLLLISLEWFARKFMGSY